MKSDAGVPAGRTILPGRGRTDGTRRAGHGRGGVLPVRVQRPAAGLIVIPPATSAGVGRVAVVQGGGGAAAAGLVMRATRLSDVQTTKRFLFLRLHGVR